MMKMALGYAILGNLAYIVHHLCICSTVLDMLRLASCFLFGFKTSSRVEHHSQSEL